MCEPRPKADIVQLMGKEGKKEARRTHQAITKAFATKKIKPPGAVADIRR